VWLGVVVFVVTQALVLLTVVEDLTLPPTSRPERFQFAVATMRAGGFALPPSIICSLFLLPDSWRWRWVFKGIVYAAASMIVLSGCAALVNLPRP
jgi:hypothetical protein